MSGRFLPQYQVQLPAKGALGGAGRGAAIGARDTVAAALSGAGAAPPGAALAAVALLALLPVISTGYAVGGAIAAPTAISVEEAETKLNAALQALKVQEVLRDHIIDLAQKEAGLQLVLLDDQGPQAQDEQITYSVYSGEGIDTVLEVSVLTLHLDGLWAIDPSLGLIMQSRALVVRTADGSVRYEHTTDYRGMTRKFTEWAADDAQLFRQELAHAYQTLAEDIVDDLFFGLYRFLDISAPTMSE